MASATPSHQASARSPSSVRASSATRRVCMRAATASVHAACSTGTSGTGTTNMVRRMASIRTSDRSS